MQVTFHLHPGPDIRVTTPFRSHLGSIQVLIQVPRIASQLHSSPISPHPGQKTCVSSPSKYHLTSIRVPGFTSHSHLLLCHVSPPFRSQESRLSSIHVTSSTFSTSTPLHPGCVSPPSRTWFKCIKVPICTYPLHRCCVSPPSRSWEQHLTFLQVSECASHLNPGPVSPPSRS